MHVEHDWLASPRQGIRIVCGGNRGAVTSVQVQRGQRCAHCSQVTDIATTGANSEAEGIVGRRVCAAVCASENVHCTLQYCSQSD